MKKNFIVLLSVVLLIANINVFAINSSVQFTGTNLEAEEGCKNIVDENTAIELYFDGVLSAVLNSASNVYANGEVMTSEKLLFTVDNQKLTLKFLRGALVAGADYVIETDNLVDAAGNIVYTPKLYVTASGEDILSEHWDLKKGDSLLMFDGRVNGTVSAGVKATNLSTGTKEYSVRLEKRGTYGNVMGVPVTQTVKSGETVDICSQIQMATQDSLYLHISSGNTEIKEVEITKKNIPDAAVLADDYWGDGFTHNDQLLPSGWSVERGSNKIEYINTESMVFNDISMVDGIVAEKQFLAVQEGVVTVETKLSFSQIMNGAAVSVMGYNGDMPVDAVKLEAIDGDLVAYEGEQPYVLTAILPGVQYVLRIEADMNSKKYSISVNDNTVRTQSAFSTNADTVCGFKISTPAEGTGKFGVGYLKVHRGYVINEQFFDNGKWVKENNVSLQSLQTGKKNDLKSIVLGSKSTNKIGSIRKDFGKLNGNSELNFRFKLTGEKEFKMMLRSNDYIIFFFEVYGTKALANGTETEELAANVWHDARMIINQIDGKYEFYINGRKQCENGFVFAKSTLGVSFEGTGEQMVDDVVLSPVSIYDTEIDVPPKDDIDVHMISYPMWREGNHFGWDRLALYEERIPYIGTYDDGNVEAMNMQLKWLAEHNVDTLVFPFVRANSNKNNAIKYYTRQEALQDGYFNSPYNSYVKFAIMWSAISAANCGGSEDFRNNIVPYWVEHFFKNDNYARTKDNRLILYVYELDSLVNTFESEAQVKEELEYLNDAVKDIGADGIYVIASTDVTIDANYIKANQCAIDSVFQYSEPTAAAYAASQLKRIKDAKNAVLRNGNVDYVPTAYMGYDTTPWRGSNNGGYLTPTDFKKVVGSVKSDVAADAYSRNKIVTLGNWNEFGEGHFLMPTDLYGFAYLDVIRDVFGGGETHTDEIPGMQQKRSCGWLYQNAGTARRVFERTDDIYNYEVLKAWYFDDPNCVNDWKSAYSQDEYKIEDGQLKITSNRDDYAPNITVDISDLGLDAQKCKYIRINVSGNWDKSAAQCGLLHFTTDINTEWYSNDSFKYGLYKNGVYTIELSNNKNWTGLIQQLRLWPGYYEKNAVGEEKLSVSIKAIELIGEQN